MDWMLRVIDTGGGSVGDSMIDVDMRAHTCARELACNSQPALLIGRKYIHTSRPPACEPFRDAAKPNMSLLS